MSSSVARLYALAAAVCVFFLAWAVIAARPWQPEPSVAASVSTAPSAELDAQRRRIERKAARLERLLSAQAGSPTPVAAVEASSPPPVQVVDAIPVAQSGSS